MSYFLVLFVTNHNLLALKNTLAKPSYVNNVLIDITLKFGIGYPGICVSGVTSMKDTYKLTRVTGRS